MCMYVVPALPSILGHHFYVLLISGDEVAFCYKVQGKCDVPDAEAKNSQPPEPSKPSILVVVYGENEDE